MDIRATPKDTGSGSRGSVPVRVDEDGRLDVTATRPLLVEVLGSVSDLASTFAATVTAAFVGSASYVWDATNSLWRRSLGDDAGRLIIAAFQSATNLLRVAEVDPLDTHGRPEIVIDVTDYTDGTYHKYIDVWGKHEIQLHIKINGGTAGAGPAGVTVKVYGIAQNDGTAPGSCERKDKTNDWFSAVSLNAAPGAGAEDLWHTDKIGGLKYVEVELEFDTNANSGDAWVAAGTIY